MHRIAAAIDVGSNSAHLLVAALDGHALVPLADESTFLGLGAQVASAGHAGHDARRAVAETIGGYASLAAGLGAPIDRIIVMGTEPLRRAADAGRLVGAVESVAGLPLFVLRHEEEAWLNVLGVTSGWPVEREIAVVDSGGGSTEVAILGPRGIQAELGLRLGSATLTAAHVRSDPPTDAEFQALRAAARAATGPIGTARADRVVLVGGTATNLVKLLPEAVADRRLTADRLRAIAEELVASPAADVVARYRLNPRRAPLLPAGVAIAEAVLDRLGADEMEVRDTGVREGAIHAVLHAGGGWRDQLPRLVVGWR